MKITLAICSLLFLPLVSRAAGTLNESAIMDSVRAGKIEEVVTELNSSNQWSELFMNIKTGKQEWLNVAESIQNSVDDEKLEELTEALAVAIPANAEGVLSILNDDSSLSVNNVCTLPVYNISDDAYIMLFIDSLKALYKTGNSKECVDRMVNNISKPTIISKNSPS